MWHNVSEHKHTFRWQPNNSFKFWTYNYTPGVLSSPPERVAILLLKTRPRHIESQRERHDPTGQFDLILLELKGGADGLVGFKQGVVSSPVCYRFLSCRSLSRWKQTKMWATTLRCFDMLWRQFWWRGWSCFDVVLVGSSNDATCLPCDLFDEWKGRLCAYSWKIQVCFGQNMSHNSFLRRSL